MTRISGQALSPSRRPKRKSDSLPTRRSKRIERSTSIEPYQYDSTDKQKRQIRLFELFRGQKDEQLRGSLNTVDLHTSPGFDAVSYVWGDPTPCSTAIVDGKLLKIPESAHKLLLGLRSQCGSMTLWIDAICINQQDVQERGHQVRFMHAIYTTARIVRVWLDTNVDFNSKPFQMARRLKLKTSPLYWEHLPGVSGAGKLRRSVNLQSFAPEFWLPIYDVLNNPYFSRVWTQQELYLARDLQFHSPGGILSPECLMRFDFATIADGGGRDYVALRSRNFRKLHPTIYHSFLVVLGPSERSSLLNLSLRSATLSTTNDIDRVFGMLGLANDYDENDFLPDYNLRPLEAYIMVIQHFVRKNRSLNFLCYYQARKINDNRNREPSSPTWLPTPDKMSSLISGLGDDWRFFTASTAKVQHQTCEFKHDVLIVRGMKVDSISMAARSHIGHTPISDLQQLESHWAMLRCTHEKYINLLVTMLAASRLGPMATEEYVTAALTAIYTLPTHNKQPDLTLIHAGWLCYKGAIATEADCAEILSEALMFCTLLETEMGQLGFSYRCYEEIPAETGDEIWVLFGCHMPMILRRQQDRDGSSEPYYSVIGTAVIPGLMKGEACEGLLDDGTPGPDYHGSNPMKINLI